MAMTMSPKLNNCRTWLIGAVLFSFTAAPSIAADRFLLKSTYPRFATFEFYETEFDEWRPLLELISGESQEVVLRSHQPHFLQLYADGARQPLGKFDFHELLRGKQGSELTLETLFHTQERTAVLNVAKMVPETRTKTEQRTSWTTETRQRTVRRFNRRTGRWYLATEDYQVRVPVTEMVEVEYTVMVPVYEQVERTYTVEVPEHHLKLNINGEVKEIVPDQHTDPDNRRRYLGVRLDNAQNGGALVTHVDAGSPATQMHLQNSESRNRYAFDPGYDVITHVNGMPVATAQDVINAVSVSPPTIQLRVHEHRRGRTVDYETKLRLLPQ